MLQNRPITMSVTSYIKAWIVREVSFIYLYLNVLSMRYVSWAGNKFVVHLGGRTSKPGNT